MTLTQMYEEEIAELRQQIQEELRQQAKEEGVKVGEKQANLRLINNLLQVRFGIIDEELTGIVEAIASLPSEEIVPLLLQLSREELLARFLIGEEKAVD